MTKVKAPICTFYEYCSHGNGATVNAKLNFQKIEAYCSIKANENFALTVCMYCAQLT